MRPAALPLCRFCLHPEPCACEPLTPERQPQRFVGIGSVSRGHAQVIRHAPQVAPEPGESKDHRVHGRRLGARAVGATATHRPSLR